MHRLVAYIQFGLTCRAAIHKPNTTTTTNNNNILITVINFNNMKLSCLQENLNKSLSIVSRVASSNKSLPILNNVLFEAVNGRIVLITTNLEIGIETVLRGKIEDDGRLTIPAQLFSNYVNLLPNKHISIETDKDNLLIVCENQKTKIKGMEAADFPIIPKIEKERGMACKKQELKKALTQVVFTVIPNDTRPEISGALFKYDLIEGDCVLNIVGTDSYRLAEKKINLKPIKVDDTKNIDNYQTIVPHATLQELLRVLEHGDPEDDVMIYFSENQIMLSLNDTELVSRIISGHYPDYKQIIPTKFTTNAIVNTNNLIKAVKSASLFSQSGVNDINLTFSPKDNSLVVSSLSTQTGENVNNLTADISGEENSTTFNYRYLLDGLQNINSTQVSLEVIDANKPGLIRPIDDESYLYIIMPIKQ